MGVRATGWGQAARARPGLPPWRGVTGRVLKPVCTSGSPPQGDDGRPRGETVQVLWAWPAAGELARTGPGRSGFSHGGGLWALTLGRLSCNHLLPADWSQAPSTLMCVVSSGVDRGKDRTLVATVCRGLCWAVLAQAACRGVARRQPEGAGQRHRGRPGVMCEVALLRGMEGTRGHRATGPAGSGVFMPQAGPGW